MSGSARLKGLSTATLSCPTGRRQSFLARHGLVLLMVVVLGAVLVFPRWWMLATQPDSGVRVPVTVWGASNMGSDEALQTTTIRDAYDGELPVRTPHLANHDGSLQAGAGWQEFVGITGRVFGGPFESLAVVTSILAIGAFAALYALSYRLTSSRLAAVAILPIATLFAHVFFHLDGYATREQWRYLEPFLTLDPEREFLAWTRFLSPVMVLATFFVLALALPRAAATGDLRWSVLATIALALLVYSYVYYWTAAALAIVLWLALLVYRREFDAVRRILILKMAAAVLALPELAMVINKGMTSNDDIAARVGQTDFGIIPGEGADILMRLIIGLPLLLVLRHRAVDHGLYIALFIAPLFLVAVDGVMPQPWHYRSQVWAQFAMPAFIAGGAKYYATLREDQRRLALRAVIALGVAAFLYVTALQIRATMILDDAYAVSEDEYAAIQWVEANVRGDETVASPSIITTLLMDNLTPAAGYIIGGYNPVAMDDELIDRYLRIQATYGYDEETTFGRLNPDHAFPFDYDGPASGLEREVEEHVAFYTFYWEVTTPARIEERIPSWRERFRSITAQDNVIAAYPAEYFYCGPRERFWPSTTPMGSTYVRVAFERNTVTIYQIADAADARAEPFGGC